MTYSDPYVPKVRLDGHELVSEDVNAMVADADCVVVVTDHASFDYAGVAESAKLIVDTRNALNGDVRRSSCARIIRL